MDLRHVLTKLIDKNDLSTEEVRFVMEFMTSENCSENPAAVGAILALLSCKGESAQEVTTFAQCLGEKCVQIPFSNTEVLLDIVGTGGDGAQTLNISTAAAILAASCGAKVAKHGNRSVSSRSGSADVLEELGIPMLSNANEIISCVQQAHIAFIYAPHFHPCMRHIAPIRKSMKIRSVFNILGPLINPARCSRVVIGVYTPKLLEIFGHCIEALGVDHGLIVHCAGLDELNSLGAPAEIVEIRKGRPTQRYQLRHEDIGVPSAPSIECLRGGTAQENAHIIERVLSGKFHDSDTILAHTIAYNAGAGLYVYGLAESIQQGYRKAMEGLEQGAALGTLQMWRSAAGRV